MGDRTYADMSKLFGLLRDTQKKEKDEFGLFSFKEVDTNSFKFLADALNF